MSSDPKRAGRMVASVLVAFAMLFTAFVVMIPRTGASPVYGGPAATCGQAPVALGSAATYAALSGTGVTSTGVTSLTGDLGVSPGTSVTGFPPGTLTGTKNVANTASAAAEADLTTAYNDAAGRSNCPVAVAGNIGGQTLTPGLYKSTSTLAISSGDLTLNGGGDPNGVFVFQVASGLTTTSGRSVVLTNGAQAGNVFWQVGSSASLGTTSVMKGTILAYAAVTLATGAHLDGRALARTADVTFAASTVVVPTVTSPTTYPVTFTESGLTAGTSWSVTFGGVQSSSTTATLGFAVVSGTYTYTTTVVGYIANPSSGSVVVSGAAASQAIAFTAATPGTFSVTFTESGLTSGTSWAVTLNGVLTASTTTQVVFNVASGTYDYMTGVVSNYTASPSTGSVTVNGAAAGQSITFTSLGGGGGGGGGGSTNGTASTGIPSWTWIAIGLIVLAALGIVAAILLSRRGKKKAA
jgi:hypothetical protein